MLRIRTINVLSSLLSNRFVWWVAGIGDAAIVYMVVKHIKWV